MNLALFDFDGTITEGDTFTPFLRFAVRPDRIAVGRLVLAPVVLGYKLHAIGASRARSAVAWVAFRGDSAARVRERGRRYAIDHLPRLIRRQALDRIEEHKAQGDRVVVVSASLDVYLKPWCDAIGVECVCTELEARDDQLTGRYRGGDCSGGAKVARIRAQLDLSRYPVVFAYGDTIEDRDMLTLAHRRIYRWAEIDDLQRVRWHTRPASTSS